MLRQKGKDKRPLRLRYRTTFGTLNLSTPKKVVFAKLFRLRGGREPVRDWVLELSVDDRRTVGQDIMAVEFGWPRGEPLCKSLTGYAGLFEVRSNLRDGRLARVFFYISGKDMVLLHGFVKKSRATPQRNLRLAHRRMKEHTRNG